MNLPEYLCARLSQPLVIDGDLDKPAWQPAPAVRLVEAATGAPTRQATLCRALYDDRFLYLAFHVEDHTIVATLTRRDDPICREEVVEAFLSPLGRTDIYYEIEVSPTGVIYDLVILNPDPTRQSAEPIVTLDQWNVNLRHAVRVDGQVNGPPGRSRAWDVEMAIPFRELIGAPHIPPRPGDRWRMNLYRIDRSAEGDEYQAWSPTGRINFHVSDRFGTLVFG